MCCVGLPQPASSDWHASCLNNMAHKLLIKPGMERRRRAWLRFNILRNSHWHRQYHLFPSSYLAAMPTSSASSCSSRVSSSFWRIIPMVREKMSCFLYSVTKWRNVVELLTAQWNVLHFATGHFFPIETWGWSQGNISIDSYKKELQFSVIN